MIDNNAKLMKSLNQVVEAMNLTEYNVGHWQTDKKDLVNGILALFEEYDVDTSGGSGGNPTESPTNTGTNTGSNYTGGGAGYEAKL
jgi:hypothetical protein